jgi:hypothetical protein
VSGPVVSPDQHSTGIAGAHPFMKCPLLVRSESADKPPVGGLSRDAGSEIGSMLRLNRGVVSLKSKKFRIRKPYGQLQSYRRRPLRYLVAALLGIRVDSRYTDSLFRKPSENEGSETQQRPRFVSAKMDVPNILIFGTLFCRDPAWNPEGGPITGGAGWSRAAAIGGIRPHYLICWEKQKSRHRGGRER